MFFLCEVTNYVSQEHQKGFQPQEEHEKKTSQVGCFLLFLALQTKNMSCYMLLFSDFLTTFFRRKNSQVPWCCCFTMSLKLSQSMTATPWWMYLGRQHFVDVMKFWIEVVLMIYQMWRIEGIIWCKCIYIYTYFILFHFMHSFKIYIYMIYIIHTYRWYTLSSMNSDTILPLVVFHDLVFISTFNWSQRFPAAAPRTY